MKYLRLLRLPDQFIQFSSAIAAGLWLKTTGWWIILWALAVTLLSCAAFIINELTDRHDTDKFSWNPTIHLRPQEKLSMSLVTIIFAALSISGLFLAYSLDLFWWALAFYTIGVFYSLKPIRFKARPVLDIVGQLFVWWVIPFLGPIAKVGNWDHIISFLIPMGCISWSLFYPYELADFLADQKAGLRGTHIVLGMNNSLRIWFLLGAFGTVVFFATRIFYQAPWLWMLIPLMLYVLRDYFVCLKTKPLTQQVNLMQQYVHQIKPISQMLTLVFLLLYFL